MYILIQSRDGSKSLDNLDDFENLTLETSMPGGFTIASFEVHRKVTQWWEDLQPFNRIIIGEGPMTVWEGYMDVVERAINPDVFHIDCLGWSARLNECGSSADITAGVGGYQGSDYCTNYIVPSTCLAFTNSDIETTDYTYPQGTRWEFSPWTSHFDALEQFNSGNGWQFGFWEDRTFFWKDPDTTEKWFVYVEDCDDISIRSNPETFQNRVLVSYTQDGTHQQGYQVDDVTSQTEYGRIVSGTITVPGRCSTATATAIGTAYINDRKDMRVAAEFTTKRVFDVNGKEHHLAEVRAGDVLRLVDWLPATDLLTTNKPDIAKFTIKDTSYDHSDHTLQVTPQEFVSRVEIRMARMEARGY